MWSISSMLSTVLRVLYNDFDPANDSVTYCYYPISLMRKLKHRDVKQLVQDYRVGIKLAPRPVF